jgi:hypothetical protein
MPNAHQRTGLACQDGHSAKAAKNAVKTHAKERSEGGAIAAFR